jgi:hypothetical protein
MGKKKTEEMSCGSWIFIIIFGICCSITNHIVTAIIVSILFYFILFFTVGDIIGMGEYSKYNYLNNKDVIEVLKEIDLMDGWKFEEYIAFLLQQLGFYDIIVTSKSGDYGADVIASKDNIKYAFQCKRFESKIGPKPIGEVLRGMNKYKCDKGVVITNNYFTKQAETEGTLNNVELWDREYLAKLIATTSKKTIKEGNNIIYYDDNNRIKINEKYQKIVICIVLVIFIVISIIVDSRTNENSSSVTDSKTSIIEQESTINKNDFIVENVVHKIKDMGIDFDKTTEWSAKNLEDNIIQFDFKYLDKNYILIYDVNTDEMSLE